MDARERPMRRIEPSSGYVNDWRSALTFAGHSRSPRTTEPSPGIVIWTRSAFAPVVAVRGGGAADASAVERASVAVTRTAARITADQRSDGDCGRLRPRAAPP